MKRIFNYVKNAPLGQKIYSFFWFLTSVFLIILVSFFSSFQSQISSFNSSEKIYWTNLVASIGFVFVILLISSIFATVIHAYISKRKVLKHE